MREHVPGVILTFASVGPLLASLMLVTAVVAIPAGFGTIGDHVAGILGAFASVRPFLATRVRVHAILSFAAAATSVSVTTIATITTTIAAVTTVTTAVTIAAFGSTAIAKIASFEVFSQNAFVIRTRSRPVHAVNWVSSDHCEMWNTCLISCSDAEFCL